MVVEKFIMLNEKNKKWTKKFDMSDKDTCHGEWNFNLKKVNGKTIIESIDIVNSNRGCQGHPKTISALIQNIPIDSINLAALSEADCIHETSCGMVLAECVNNIKDMDL